MEGFDLADSLLINKGSSTITALYLGSELIWPPNYAEQYLTIKALTNGCSVEFRSTENIGISISYSFDRINWVTKNSYDEYDRNTLATLSKGQKLYLKGNNQAYAKKINNTVYPASLAITGECNVTGNIMSLIYGDNFIGETTLPAPYAFYNLFSFSDIINAQYLILPATTMTEGCYGNLFYNCTLLRTIPELHVTTLAKKCYYHMFMNCASLTTPPALPVTTLAESCYSSMFSGCSSLVTAPALPATTLAQECYASMFDRCSSLVTAPALPATTLAESCYSRMFSGCESLTAAPALPVTSLTDHCYASMFSGCESLTTAPELPATTLRDYCYNSMFSGCESLTTAPALPATTLAVGCYSYMFSGCESLTTAPALPATTLAEECYQNMFSGCTSLTTAPVLLALQPQSYAYGYMFKGCTSLNSITCALTTVSTMSTYEWVYDVAPTGIFYKHPTMTSWTVGNNGIPINWTVQDIVSYNISIASGIAHGTISSDKSIAMAGELVTIIVTPDTGYELNTLTVTQNGTPITVTNNTFTMPEGDVTITGTFQILYYDIDIETDLHGTVTTTPSSTAYYGQTVTVNFTPDTGYELSRIDVNQGETHISVDYNDNTFTMPAGDVDVNVTFRLIEYPIHIITDFHGSVTVDTHLTGYDNIYAATYGQTVTITTTPNTGYQLDTLTVTDANNNPITVTNNQFTMPAAVVNINAAFIQSQHIISINNTTHGTVTTNPIGTAVYNQNVTITTTPNTGYQLDTLNVIASHGGYILVHNNQFTMPDYDVTINATFSQISYNVNIASGITGGTVTANKQTAHYGEVVTLTVTSNQGYELKTLTVVGATSSSSITVTNNQFVMPAESVNINATFSAIPQYRINVASASNGTVTTSPSGKATYGQTVTVTTTPDTGYKQYTLTVKGILSGSSITVTNNQFTMPDEAVTVVATFAEVHAVDTYASATQGTITANPQYAIQGETVHLTFSPNTGYEKNPSYEVLKKDGSYDTVSHDSNDNFIMPNCDVVIDLPFAAIRYNVAIDSSIQNGTITSNRQTATYGQTVTLTVTPDSGYNLDTLTVVGATSGSSVTVTNNQFVMPAEAVTVNATFELDYSSEPFTIEALEDNVTISINNQKACQLTYTKNGGTSKTLTVSANVTEALDVTLDTGDICTFTSTNWIQYGAKGHFIVSGQFKVYGNLMSLKDYSTSVDQQGCEGALSDNVGLIDATNLVMPATTLGQSAYGGFFMGCSSLVSAPKELPVNGNNSHALMFGNCTSLVNPPKLLFTDIDSGGCNQMFRGCTSLVKAPDLNITNVASYGCYQMFYGCTNLNYVKCTATTISGYTNFNSWLYGVAASGTFVKDANSTLWGSGSSGIPTGWTVVDI